MALYIDTSFLLAIIRQELEALVAIWEQDEVRIKSILLHAECMVTLRRLGREADTERMLEELISEVSLRTVDAGIIGVLASEAHLSGCRTLDVLHLATALDFKRRTGIEPVFCSLDQRLRSIATDLGFRLQPE